MAQGISRIDLSASQQPRLAGSNISAYCLAVIAVTLRFASRKLAGAGFWWDDWLILLAMILVSVVFFSSVAWLLRSGFGRHIEVAGLTGATVFAEVLFLSEVCYTLIITLTKYSILAFYWRIFHVSTIRLPIYILGAITTAWGIACLFVNIFQCVPVNGFWNKSIGATCGVNDTQFFYGQSIPNILTDIAILVLPIRFIWHLQAPRTQKILLTGTFITGGLVIAVSITRLTYLVHLNLVSPDVTWNFVDVQVWTTIEVDMAVISACLPSLRPIVTYVFPGAPHRSNTLETASGRDSGKFRSLNTRSSRNPHLFARSGTQQFSKNSADRDLIRSWGLNSNRNASAQIYAIGDAAGPDITLHDLEHGGGITVTRDIDVRG